MTVVLDSIEHVWVEFYNSIGLKFSSRQTKTKTRSYCLKLKKKKRNPWISKSNSINLDLLHLSFFYFLQMPLSFAQSLNVKIEKKKSQKIKITQNTHKAIATQSSFSSPSLFYSQTNTFCSRPTAVIFFFFFTQTHALQPLSSIVPGSPLHVNQSPLPHSWKVSF